jgi:hypothetical protein
VRALTVRERGGTLRILCQSEGDCELELWGVPRRAALLEDALKVKVQVEAAPLPAAPPAPVPLRRRLERA